MLVTHEENKDYKTMVQEAVAKATEIGQNLRTFEMEAEPVVKEITKDGTTVTEVTLKATGADRNYSQFSMNYLKGEIENHGNAATDVFAKLWKSQHLPKGDDVSPWIGRKTYPTIVETLTGQANDPDQIGFGVLKGKCYDPDQLAKWDAQRQEFEKTLKAKAPAIISAVRQQYNAANVLMATMSGKIVYKDLDKDFVSETGSQTITDKKAELEYIEKTLPTTRGVIHLFHKVQELIKNSGELDCMRQQAEAMEEAKPLIEGSVKAYEEEQAKAARAAAREDAKADKDKELKINIVKTFEMGATLQMITMLTKVTTAKAEEILKEAGYDPKKPYSEQAKAKVNVIPDEDEVYANDKDAKLRQTILDMNSIFTSEEIAKYLGLSEIFVAKILDESD